jgi:hypothetical protein
MPMAANKPADASVHALSKQTLRRAFQLLQNSAQLLRILRV